MRGGMLRLVFRCAARGKLLRDRSAAHKIPVMHGAAGILRKLKLLANLLSRARNTGDDVIRVGLGEAQLMRGAPLAAIAAPRGLLLARLAFSLFMDYKKALVSDETRAFCAK